MERGPPKCENEKIEAGNISLTSKGNEFLHVVCKLQNLGSR